jgi:hypothetical protein
MADSDGPRHLPIRSHSWYAMPTVTLTLDTLAAFGVLRAHLVPTLTLEGRGLLEALLASRGFDMPGRSEWWNLKAGRVSC